MQVLVWCCEQEWSQTPFKDCESTGTPTFGLGYFLVQYMFRNDKRKCGLSNASIGRIWILPFDLKMMLEISISHSYYRGPWNGMPYLWKTFLFTELNFYYFWCFNSQKNEIILSKIYIDTAFEDIYIIFYLPYLFTRD